jgi:hypothetical protein
MADAISLFASWLGFAFWSAMSAFTSLEPKSSVWILAGFGSSLSALRGEPRGVFNGLFNWITGMFASVAFVVGVDHFQPEAEAVLVGLVSTEGVKAWRWAFSHWVAGVIPRISGGQSHAQ